MKKKLKMNSWKTVFALLVMIMFASITSADAAFFAVDTTTDAVDASPGNGVCATSGGVCTLRAAVMEANALTGTDTITIPAGIFTLSISGTYEDASATGDIDIIESVVINGQGQLSTIVDGNAFDRVFHIINTASLVTISNLTIQNGSINNTGGGLYNDTATLTMNNVTVKNCTSAGNEGGGIYNDQGTITLNDCLITQNTARYGAGVNNSDGTVTMTNTIISNNTGSGTWGGGGFVNESATATLTNVQIINNTGYTGGGIFSIPGSVIHITDSLIDNNTSTQYGGGIYNMGGSIDITDSTISNNKTLSHYAGAGIYNVSNTPGYTASFTLRRVTISGNYNEDGGDGDGGGIYNTQSGGGIASIFMENVTISGNTGDCLGGGIINHGTLDILNTTISNNIARYCPGGGIYSSSVGTTTIKNSVISGNLAEGTEGNCDISGTFISNGHNISSDITCGLSGTGDMNSTDPMLGPLQDNGGTTFTHALLTGSSAIDAGDNAGCPPTDQRGISRPYDGDNNGSAICDIGAFEYSLMPDLTGNWEEPLTETCKEKKEGLACKVKGKFSLRNMGEADAQYVKVRLYLSKDDSLDESDILLKESMKNKVLVGKDYKKSYSLTLPVGMSIQGRYIIVYIDADDTTTESSEGNNFVVYGEEE